MAREEGQALPLAIFVLAVGALVMAPFLGHAGTSLMDTGVLNAVMNEQNAADAGVEHAIWNLTVGGLSGMFVEDGDSLSYQLGEPVNGLNVGVTVNADSIAALVGQIAGSAIDTLEYDPADGNQPAMAYVDQDIYAIAYRGTDSDGFLKTIRINSGGAIDNTVIDTLEFDTANGFEPDIARVSGGIVAVVYRGTDSDGFIKTISIDTTGNISSTAIDTLEFDTVNCLEPDIIRVSDNVFAVAYRGQAGDGFVKTLFIASDGMINDAAIDTLEFDTADGFQPDIINVSGDIYVIAYNGTNNDGFVKTVSIAADGTIGNAVIDSLEFDTADGSDPAVANISGNIFAIAYSGPSSDGFLKTISITPAGDISNTVIDTLEFDPAVCNEPSLVNIADNCLGIAYRGPGSDGFITAVMVADDGHIASAAVDTLEYDTANGFEPDIIHVSGDVYAVAYRGTSADGFIQTVNITSLAGFSADFEILATAGETSMRAFVNTANQTSSVISWRVE